MPTPSSNRFKSRGRNHKKNLSRLVVASIVGVLYLACQLYLARLYHLGSLPDAYFNNVPVRLRDARDVRPTVATTKNQKSSHYNYNYNYDKSFHSSVHCVGETHDPATAWKHRSCSYVHLCLDMGGGSKTPEFFLVTSKSQEQFQSRFRNADSAHGKYRYSSTEILGDSNSNGKSNTNNSTIDTAPTQYSPIDVALGGINPSWRAPPTPRVPYQHGIDKIKWAPRIYDKIPSEKYYELDPNVILVPYHSFAAANIGHLLWDDFLPLYNLLKIFGFDENTNNNNVDLARDGTQKHGKGYQHLLLRVDTMPGLFGTCDLRPKKKEACKRNLERFLPLFGVDPDTFSTLTEARLTSTMTSSSTKGSSAAVFPPPPLYPICAKRAVAGLGWLTDHGIRNHGWMANHEEDSLDVALARNVGRGPELYSFRDFVLRNLGFETSSASAAAAAAGTSTKRINNPPGKSVVSFRILLSAHSSEHTDRSFGLQAQQKALAEAFPNTEILVLDLSAMPLLEQISLVSNQLPEEQQQHTIFVSACGGGSATAYFLPRGSSLVLYYNEVGGMDYFSNERKTGGPALLDWDLMNNLGYLMVHWLPIGSMDEPEGLDALVSLVHHEMDGVLNGI